MSDSPLYLNNVTCAYNGAPVLQELNLGVRQNEFVVVVGPSGCGKTTLLHLLCGHLSPSSGSLHRDGSVRMIYQSDGLFPWLTAGENIALGLRGVDDREDRARQMRDLLALVRLEHFAGHYPYQLSGGMRQLVEVARAMAGDTRILLMDEPFCALDYLTRMRMRGELCRMLAARPRTVVLVTHDIEEAALLADRIIVLTERPGRICHELKVNLPRPRSLAHSAVLSAMQEVLSVMGLASK
jgi:ABC-type nitrate/sulfonate/bicarbonate transport system ATPase subunit